MRAQQVHDAFNISVLIAAIGHTLKHALHAQLVAVGIALLAHAIAEQQNAIARLQLKLAEFKRIIKHSNWRPAIAFKQCRGGARAHNCAHGVARVHHAHHAAVRG